MTDETKARESYRRLSQSQRQYYSKLSRAVARTFLRFLGIAELGRPGLWVLHKQDLYRPEFDTRPESRSPDREVAIHDVKYHGVPLLRSVMFWSGSGPPPNFEDIGFWEDTLKSLDEKTAEAKARSIQPQFTSSELQTIEKLEQQPRHVFHVELVRQQRVKTEGKFTVFYKLFVLARLGRPGQWILHQEGLYHPVIDTRPESRKAAGVKNVALRDSTFDGVELEPLPGVFADFELHWSGTGPQPDFDDFYFWKCKIEDLNRTITDIKEGNVPHHFPPDALRRLEAMEKDKGHAFATIAALPPVELHGARQTSEEIALDAEIDIAQDGITNSLMHLWDAGLAGKWVLHHEKLYLPEHDITNREQAVDHADSTQAMAPITNVLVQESSGLRFDIRGAGPLPDFKDVAFWKEKRADLRKKVEAVQAEAEAGRRRTGRKGPKGHKFTKAELMRIALLERAIQQSYEEPLAQTTAEDIGSGAKPAAGGVLGWLNNVGAESERDGRHGRHGTPEPELSTSKREVAEPATRERIPSVDDQDAAVSGPTRHAMTTRSASKRKRLSEENDNDGGVEITVSDTAAPDTKTFRKSASRTVQPTKRGQRKGQKCGPSRRTKR